MSRRTVRGKRDMCDQTLVDGAPIVGAHLTREDPLRLDVSNEREHPAYVRDRGDRQQYLHRSRDTRDRGRDRPAFNGPQDRELTVGRAVLISMPSEEPEYRAGFKVVDPLTTTGTRAMDGVPKAQR